MSMHVTRRAVKCGPGPLRAGRCRGIGLLLFAATTALVGGCSSAGAAPQPAGAEPSAISKMVCTPEAQLKITAALGSTATVSVPTWSDDLYRCVYRFPHGTLALSVKELSSRYETDAYFDSLVEQLGRSQQLFGLGQGAFLTTDGSVVARKDWKVLLVDNSRAGASLGAGHSFSGTPAETVASLIMTCWQGD